MKIKLIGKPGRIEKRRDLIITTLTCPDLPSVADMPEAEDIQYTVFISERQWQRTVKSLFKQKALLVVEGYCSYNPEIGSMAVYALSAQVQPGPNSEGRTNTRHKSSAPVSEKSDTPNNAVNDVQPQAQSRLRELEDVAEIYRQKLADIQSKPEDQQFGLDMTQKLLRNVENEIAALLGQSQSD